MPKATAASSPRPTSRVRKRWTSSAPSAPKLSSARPPSPRTTRARTTPAPDVWPKRYPTRSTLNQYDNPANAVAHYETTGPELWAQTEGRITHFIAGAGTGGTISGAAKYLKEQNPDVQVVGVDPYGSVYYTYFQTGTFDEKEIYPYLTEGVGEDILAGNMDFEIVDDYVRVDDKESMQMTRRLAREEGLFVGQSCGMAMAGALDWLRSHRGELSEEDVVVVLLPDSGFRYLSKTYNDNWMRDHGFLERRPDVTVDHVLQTRRQQTRVLAVAPADTLGQAIQGMAEHGISQMPVIENEQVVGSLNESVILNRLIAAPDARDQAVREVMGEPFPIVPRALHLEHLSAYLEQGTGAVLVEPSPGDGAAYEIITKSDLISALASAGRSGRNGE